MPKLTLYWEDNQISTYQYQSNTVEGKNSPTHTTISVEVYDMFPVLPGGIIGGFLETEDGTTWNGPLEVIEVEANVTADEVRYVRYVLRSEDAVFSTLHIP